MACKGCARPGYKNGTLCSSCILINKVNNINVARPAPLEHFMYDLVYNRNFKKVPRRKSAGFPATYITYNVAFYSWMNEILKYIDLGLFPPKKIRYDEFGF